MYRLWNTVDHNTGTHVILNSLMMPWIRKSGLRYVFLDATRVDISRLYSEFCCAGVKEDQRVAGSIPKTTDFLTNSSGQATNTLVFLFTKSVN